MVLAGIYCHPDKIINAFQSNPVIGKQKYSLLDLCHTNINTKRTDENKIMEYINHRSFITTIANASGIAICFHALLRWHLAERTNSAK